MTKETLEIMIAAQANGVEETEIDLINDLSDVAYNTDIHIGMIRQHFDSTMNYIKENHERSADFLVPSVICAAIDELLISARCAGYDIDKNMILDCWHSAPIDLVESWDDWGESNVLSD